MTGSVTDLSASTKLALDRTRLAHERTLMAWVRTAASLISFGFTIYKFFQYLRDGKPVPEGQVLGPRGFALSMIAIGLGALVVAVIEHRRNLQALRAEYGAGRIPASLATIVGGLVATLGMVGLLIVWLHK
jgi:putative membrane protein